MTGREDMSRELVIKGIALGSGIPVICVPITASVPGEILTEARRLVASGVQMIEWRLDYLEDPTNTNVIRQLLMDLKPICENSILLATLRSSNQGGRARLDERAFAKSLMAIATSHVADLIDVEYFFRKEGEKELIASLQKEGARVIASQHDFHRTPSAMDLISTLLTMEESGADLVKIAVMPHSSGDVLHLLDASSTFSENAQTPLIAMAMGHLGTISRVGGELFGSCVTFASMGASSAPGQFPVEDVKTVMEILHRYSAPEEQHD